MREFKLWHVSKDPRGTDFRDLSRAGGLHGMQWVFSLVVVMVV